MIILQETPFAAFEAPLDLRADAWPAGCLARSFRNNTTTNGMDGYTLLFSHRVAHTVAMECI